MKIRALIGFTGVICLRKGEIAECSDEAVLRDLIAAGYVEPAEPPEPERTPPNESPVEIETLVAPSDEPAKPKATKQSKKVETSNENQ